MGACFILFLLIMAIFAPMLSSHAYDSVMMDHVNLPPRIPFLEKLGIFDGTHNGVNVYEQRGLENVYYFSEQIRLDVTSGHVFGLEREFLCILQRLLF